MPSAFEEENLRFVFSDDWQVVQFDRHEYFVRRLMPLQLTKAVDFIALYKERDLYLIEVKDYRGRPIELKNADKESEGGPLHLSVARKVKDSVAGIIGAARVVQREAFWGQCASVLRDRHRSVRIVFWLEFDVPGHRGRSRFNGQRMRQLADLRRERGKQSLSWLTKEFQIANLTIDASVLPGVKVTNIERAGAE